MGDVESTDIRGAGGGSYVTVSTASKTGWRDRLPLRSAHSVGSAPAAMIAASNHPMI